MERKNFLKSLMVGAVSTSVLVEACKKDTTSPTTTTTTSTSTSSGSTTSCSVIETETEGPYPTHTPASYVRSDITDGRTGYALTVKITVNNSNNSCNALSGALVDIWHCDAEGNYSEYGGSGTQATNYTTVHFLRGRQTTDANGLVTFTSIFPGWYTGRATHIHVHVYNSAGTSLKVTQIAFPEGTGTALAAVAGYTKGMTGYTYNATDGVFSDGYALELATITGSTTAGFALSISMSVPA
ncbi:intradiol ring-cleavage dioxygenase [Mucilaginibacter dorajii]|uniref:Intradiol ring-cleavage dioxygenases domain-containing protein n=1 Tax=Mucilaginibacter dorajii TaxID=692994 RepID=A0ABP7P588_9SPHI|nr:intradiol ring-cleavage dioxygenase [Mucilaginibacter dorajii]MCS3734504.1 protocatechuate 3,4-dioxygenase beta subunit [Mucilaginibacter dorajii]